MIELCYVLGAFAIFGIFFYCFAIFEMTHIKDLVAVAMELREHFLEQFAESKHFPISIWLATVIGRNLSKVPRELYVAQMMLWHFLPNSPIIHHFSHYPVFSRISVNEIIACVYQIVASKTYKVSFYIGHTPEYVDTKKNQTASQYELKISEMNVCPI